MWLLLGAFAAAIGLYDSTRLLLLPHDVYFEDSMNDVVLNRIAKLLIHSEGFFFVRHQRLDLAICPQANALA